MHWSNEWFAAEAETETGKKILVNGRMFTDNVRESGEYPMRMEIQWSYKGSADGLPTPEETEIIDRIMDISRSALENSRTAILTSMQTGCGQALYTFYTQNIDRFSEKINDILSKLPPLPIKIGAEKDEKWDAHTALVQKFALK